MRIIVRILLALFALVIAIGALEIAASESGEVVVLQTQDAAGAKQETRVWVVDEGGHAYIRAGDPRSSWLLNIQKNPAVEVERGGKSAAFTAVPDVASRDRINAALLAKYGWADRVIAALFGREDATPIRLDPAR